MFSFHCPVHGHPVLLWPRAMTAIENTPDGIHVHFRCSCGFEGVWVTGRGVREHVRAAGHAHAA